MKARFNGTRKGERGLRGERGREEGGPLTPLQSRVTRFVTDERTDTEASALVD